ncbi:MAG: hypothetical protein RIR31_729, partial [Bacteroidota bacterium]
LFTQVLVSCNQKSSNTKANQNNFTEATTTDNKDIFGTWTMCSSSDKDAMIQMNTCPIIVFKNNGRGFVQINLLITENFDWTLEKRSMKIIYANKNATLIFPDTNYYADFNKQKGRIDLMLRHNDNIYYLSK